MKTLKFSETVSSYTFKNFKNNIIRQHGEKFCTTYLEENAYSPTIVLNAFVWDDTPEGAHYWLETHKAWIKYLNAQKNL